MQIVRVEKRLPFGFRGDWGKVYKAYKFDETNEAEVIEYQKTNYYEIGMDVQFKPMEGQIDADTFTTTPIENLITKSKNRIVKTTDAYFDNQINEYCCVVGLGDIVKVFGSYWIATQIKDKDIFTPRKQTFYIIELRKIAPQILKR